jgi:hypothetical protein
MQAGEKAIPELVQKLNDPRQIAKLKEHATTGVYFKASPTTITILYLSSLEGGIIY